MTFHTKEEEEMLASFRESRGVRVFFHKKGKLKLPRPEAKTLARLIRSGHIVRAGSGDLHAVYYRLREVPIEQTTLARKRPSGDAPIGAADGERD